VNAASLLNYLEEMTNRDLIVSWIPDWWCWKHCIESDPSGFPWRLYFTFANRIFSW